MYIPHKINFTIITCILGWFAFVLPTLPGEKPLGNTALIVYGIFNLICAVKVHFWIKQFHND